jgi:hypothetical protein
VNALTLKPNIKYSETLNIQLFEVVNNLALHAQPAQRRRPHLVPTYQGKAHSEFVERHLPDLKKESRLLRRHQNFSCLVAIQGVVAVMVVAWIVGVVAMMVTVVEMMVAVVAMMVVAMMIAVPSCGWNGTAGCNCANNT